MSDHIKLDFIDDTRTVSQLIIKENKNDGRAKIIFKRYFMTVLDAHLFVAIHHKNVDFIDNTLLY